ncbi:MAG TPA: hypothetical protein PK600_03345, partial [Deltaproteobacteria bacterium]|nr:hypothetical protein [Deltaproteobacteria bacterium]
MDQVYKIKKSLKVPMLLAVVISLPVFVDVISSGFPTKTLIMAITLMVLFYLFTLNNLIKRVIVSSGEVSIKGLFGSSRIALGDISRLD